MRIDLTAKNIERAAHSCLGCRTCVIAEWPQYDLEICPSWKRWRFWSYSAGGRMHTIRSLSYGLIDLDETVRDVFFKCPNCGACAEYCGVTGKHPPYFNPQEIIIQMRKELAEKGFSPPRHKVFYESTMNVHNPYGEPHEMRLAWLTERLPDKADVMLFTGCTAPYRAPGMAQASVRVLKVGGVNVGAYPDEWECGSVLWRTGQWDMLEGLAKHNADWVKASGAKALITYCPGCYTVLKSQYPDWGFELSAEVLHATEYFAKLIDDGKMRFRGKTNKTVTYHDPCHLGRAEHVYDEPRKILESLPGINFVEMPRNRVNSWCCGAGGGVKGAYPDWAVENAAERVQEAVETGAEILVTACPFCVINLRDAIDKTRAKIKVMDISELMLEVL